VRRLQDSRHGDEGGASAAFFAREFKVVKVDVGRFNRNVEIAAFR
jgi:hypothetical protein